MLPWKPAHPWCNFFLCENIQEVKDSLYLPPPLLSPPPHLTPHPPTQTHTYTHTPPTIHHLHLRVYLVEVLCCHDSCSLISLWDTFENPNLSEWIRNTSSKTQVCSVPISVSYRSFRFYVLHQKHCGTRRRSTSRVWWRTVSSFAWWNALTWTDVFCLCGMNGSLHINAHDCNIEHAPSAWLPGGQRSGVSQAQTVHLLGERFDARIGSCCSKLSTQLSDSSVATFTKNKTCFSITVQYKKLKNKLLKYHRENWVSLFLSATTDVDMTSLSQLIPVYRFRGHRYSY